MIMRINLKKCICAYNLRYLYAAYLKFLFLILVKTQYDIVHRRRFGSLE